MKYTLSIVVISLLSAASLAQTPAPQGAQSQIIDSGGNLKMIDKSPTNPGEGGLQPIVPTRGPTQNEVTSGVQTPSDPLTGQKPSVPNPGAPMQPQGVKDMNNPGTSPINPTPNPTVGNPPANTTLPGQSPPTSMPSNPSSQGFQPTGTGAGTPSGPQNSGGVSSPTGTQGIGSGAVGGAGG